jgi:hypothetical protein
MKNFHFYPILFLSICFISPLKVKCITMHDNVSFSKIKFDSSFEIIYSLFQTTNLVQNEIPIVTKVIETEPNFMASWPNISSWGNKKRKHGRYKENEMNEEGPYFLFDRYTNGQPDDYIKLNNKLSEVRKIIKNDDYFRLIYIEILAQADSNLEICSESNDDFCVGASRAKAAAFVYLIGLKADKTNFTVSERNAYRDKVLNYFKYVKAKGLDNFWDNASWIPIGGQLASLLGALGNWEELVERSKELTNILQAYDMIKWGYKLDNELDYSSTDIEEKLEEYGLRIIDKYVVPIHRRAANGVYLFAQNNYSLIISASMISAAIEFNDFGVRWFNVESRPNRWAESGYSYIHKTLWKGSGKMSNEDTFIWQNGLKS